MITSTIRPGATNSGSFAGNDAVFPSLAVAETAAQSWVADTYHVFEVEDGNGSAAGAVTLSGWDSEAELIIRPKEGHRWQDKLEGTYIREADLSLAAKIQMPTAVRAISIGMGNVTIEDMCFLCTLTSLDSNIWSMIRWTTDSDNVHIRRNMFMIRTSLDWGDSDVVSVVDHNYYNITDSSITDNIFIAQTLQDSIGLELLRAINLVVKGPSDSLVCENNTIWSSTATGIYTGGFDYGIRISGVPGEDVVLAGNLVVDSREEDYAVAAGGTIDDNIDSDGTLGIGETVPDWSSVLTTQNHDSPDPTTWDATPKGDALLGVVALYKERSLDAFRNPRLSYDIPAGDPALHDIGAVEKQYNIPTGHSRQWFYLIEDAEELYNI